MEWEIPNDDLTPVDIEPGADLREADLSEAVLVEADLSGADLLGADLSGADLGGANLSGADLINADRLGANLSFADLSEADLRGASLLGADLSFADLSGATLSTADLYNANWANLSDANLIQADLSGADLFGADLSGANLSFADLSGASLFNADLSEADLTQANLSEANLESTDLSEVDLTQANLSKANLESTDLSEADLKGADLPNATLTGADLSNANIRDATLWYATLEDTVLTTADCRGTDFRSTRLYQAIFRDTRINSTTQFVNQGIDFFGKCTYELSPDEILADDEDEFDYDCHPYEAAAWTYRRLQSLHEENALSEHTRDFHIRKEEVHRKNHRRVRNYPTWTVATLSKCFTNYGESFKHLFRTWAITIVVFGFLYPFAGGFIADSTNEVYRLQITLTPSLGDVLGSLRVLAHSMYFSIITFTTIGYGDLYPAGAVSKALVGAESLAGGILVALFVFVLGRRVAR